MVFYIFALVAFCLVGAFADDKGNCPVSVQEGSVWKCIFHSFAFNSFDGVHRSCKMLTGNKGNLAIVNTKEKTEALVRDSDIFMRGEPAMSFWIGLKYDKKRQMWIWKDGTPLNNIYANWATINKGEIKPDKENCAAINLYSAVVMNSTADQGKWHIDDCEAARPYLCEITTPTKLPQPRFNRPDITKAGIYFEKQPKGHSCVGGMSLVRYTEEFLCQQFCLVNTECVGYIMPTNGNKECVAKSKTCKTTFAETSYFFYKKMSKEKGWLNHKKADLEEAVDEE